MARKKNKNVPLYFYEDESRKDDELLRELKSIKFFMVGILVEMVAVLVFILKSL